MNFVLVENFNFVVLLEKNNFAILAFKPIFHFGRNPILLFGKKIRFIVLAGKTNFLAWTKNSIFGLRGKTWLYDFGGNTWIVVLEEIKSWFCDFDKNDFAVFPRKLDFSFLWKTWFYPFGGKFNYFVSLEIFDFVVLVEKQWSCGYDGKPQLNDFNGITWFVVLVEKI